MNAIKRGCESKYLYNASASILFSLMGMDGWIHQSGCANGRERGLENDAQLELAMTRVS